MNNFKPPDWETHDWANIDKYKEPMIDPNAIVNYCKETNTKKVRRPEDPIIPEIEPHIVFYIMLVVTGTIVSVVLGSFTLSIILSSIMFLTTGFFIKKHREKWNERDKKIKTGIFFLFAFCLFSISPLIIAESRTFILLPEIIMPVLILVYIFREPIGYAINTGKYDEYDPFSLDPVDQTLDSMNLGKDDWPEY